LNNYKKKAFIPIIQKTSTLVFLSLLALVCLFISLQNRSIEISPLYDSKIKAANLMKQCLQSLKKSRLENSIFIDIENDPNETGIVGVPYSLITTDEGDLDAKLTTLDPNFSAVIVDLLFTAGLEKNDTIAVMLTGSMPGANIALLSACQVMGIHPIIISSIGASQWGANQVDFMWLDMEDILIQNKLINSRSVASSIGGRNDMGRLLSPLGRDLIMENIKNYDLPLIKENRLADNIKKRTDIYNEYHPIDKYDGVVNIGGGVASLGTSFNYRLIPPGIVNRSDIVDIDNSSGIEGAFSIFLKKNIPGLHILNIKSIIENYNLPFAPIPHPKIGEGVLYAKERYNLTIVFLCFLILTGSVAFIGYKSKKQIREHLTKYEPDSLL
jgi:poly-gamma-glutamate system protein